MRIPYSAVPGLDTNSRAYRKAERTLAKAAAHAEAKAKETFNKRENTKRDRQGAWKDSNVSFAGK